jgi:hypothetical protein
MSFDPGSFLNTQVVGANDTKLVPIPVGEYIGITESVDCVPWQSKEDTSKSGLKLVVTIGIDNETVKSITGRDKPTVKHDVMLDINPGGQGLDMGKGKNVSLGRLREALQLNNPNEPFSFLQIPGRPIKVSIKHREYKGDLFAEVGAVAKA